MTEVTDPVADRRLMLLERWLTAPPVPRGLTGGVRSEGGEKLPTPAAALGQYCFQCAPLLPPSCPHVRQKYPELGTDILFVTLDERAAAGVVAAALFMFSGGTFIIGGGFARGVDPLACAGVTFTAVVSAAPARAEVLVADVSALGFFFFLSFAGGPVIGAAGRAESGPAGGRLAFAAGAARRCSLRSKALCSLASCFECSSSPER